MVYIRFEAGQEGRISKEYGPFPFAQLTYDLLRVGPDGEYFADYNHMSNEWYCRKESDAWYSDVVIYHK